MRLQAGGQGYVPGVSGDIWYGGLKGRLSEAGDVIREGAGDVRDYMSQRGLSSMVGSVGGQFAGKKLGKWLLKNALKKTLFATNPLLGFGLEAGLGALGAYAGTRGAGSKGFLSLLGKDEPTIKKTKTGLLSGDIDYLEEMKGDIDEDIKGRATGSAITSLLSSLTSEAAGQAWGKYKGVKDVSGVDVQGTAGLGPSERDIYGNLSPEMQEGYLKWAHSGGRDVSNRTIADWYSSPEFMESPFAEFATKQAGGSVYENPVSYQEGGGSDDREKQGRLAGLLLMLSGAGRRQERRQGAYEEMMPQDMPQDALTADAIQRLLKWNYKPSKMVESVKRDMPRPAQVQDFIDVGLPVQNPEYEHPGIFLDESGQRRMLWEDLEGLDLPRYLQGYQQGGYMPEYQMGGSTYQESPSYQLNGLLKYKRNPIVG